jgi:nucleotide-binding universal stress UspA family protein
MFTHILLPTDGSDESLRAAKIGIDLAKQVGARVYAFHVLAPLAAVSYFSDLIRSSANDYCHGAIERAQLQLDVIQSMAKEAGVLADGGYVFDHRPYTAIIGAAHKQLCDLIVMGSHGYTGVDRLVLGSETHKVLSCSDIPVLVCR